MSKLFAYDYAVVLDWHDGDTCHGDIDMGFGQSMRAYRIDGTVDNSWRIWGINAPELKIKNASGQWVDNQPGIDALDYAEQLCPPGTWVKLTSHSWDRDPGRIDVSIILPDGTDFGTLMVNSGHAVVMK